MFVNCPHCRTLVATDPATDLPPPFCPECGGPLRGAAAEPGDAWKRSDEAEAEAVPASMRPAVAADEAHRDSWWDEAALRGRDDDAPESEQAGSAQAAAAHRADASVRLDPNPNPDTAGDSGSDSAAVPSRAELAPAAGPGVAAKRAPGAAAALAAARVAPVRGGLPGFLRRPAGAPARRDWRMPAAVVGLGLLLVLQILLADRARLAGQAGWRPLLGALCAGLRCDLPPWREPGAFTLLQRDVRQHPTRPGVLRVSATFRNDARWPQPWPRLRLSLADVDGRTAGARSFSVEEYLGGAPAQAELASGETATVAMDILEPAPDIVAFDFAFR